VSAVSEGAANGKDSLAPGRGVAPELREVRERAVREFQSIYAGEPTHAAVAPGRVNLIGEHTDYNGGFVLPIAIDRATVAVARVARGQEGFGIFLHSAGFSREPLRFTLGDLADEAKWRAMRGTPDSWLLYAAGAVAGLVRRGGQRLASIHEATTAPLQIAVATSVPKGGGVSSSASFETAVCRVVEAVAGLDEGSGAVSPRERAELCQWGDHTLVGVPCGIMDQYASSAGRAGHAMLIDCRSNECEHVPMPPESEAVVLVADTRVHHELANSEYPKRVEACRGAAAKLGVGLLRDATPEMVEENRGKLSRDEYLFARHVTTEDRRAVEAVGALRAGNLARFGELMNASHVSLRDDYRVSSVELDTLVDAAWVMGPSGGVFGARMTGGGFGGCAVALVRPGAAEAVARSLEVAYRARFGRECSVFVTRASDGARVIPLRET
jgi:galactokinase